MDNLKDIESELRIKLAAAHHVIKYYNYDDLLATHLSARIPNTKHILITPMDTPFEEVCASNLLKVDLDGNIISSNNKKLMPQAINIHAGVYKNSDKIMSAMHTHSIYGVATSTLKSGILFFNQQALRFYNDVAYYDYNTLALDKLEGEHIAKCLGNKKVMVLYNHGLLATGESIEKALYLTYYLEQVCEIQIKTLSANSEIINIPENESKKTKEQFESIFNPEEEFKTLLRRVDGKFKTNFRD